MSVPSIAVVGTGPVARAIARGHSDCGGRVVAVISRDAERARAVAVGARSERGTTDLAAALTADVVIVAVRDRAVPAVGDRLAALDRAGDCVILHTSGALSGSDLGDEPLRIGSLHPLQSFTEQPGAEDPDAALAARLAGVHWFHEGAGRDEARALVDAWGGVFHALQPGGKALYHAGAAILSNHTIALAHAATRLFTLAGVPPADAAPPLARLLTGTARNVAEIGLPGALTGPVSRGDVATVHLHLKALRDHAPELLPSYVEMARLAIEVAVQQGGVDAEREVALRAVLDDVSRSETL